MNYAFEMPQSLRLPAAGGDGRVAVGTAGALTVAGQGGGDIFATQNAALPCGVPFPAI